MEFQNIITNKTNQKELKRYLSRVISVQDNIINNKPGVMDPISIISAEMDKQKTLSFRNIETEISETLQKNSNKSLQELFKSYQLFDNFRHKVFDDFQNITDFKTLLSEKHDSVEGNDSDKEELKSIIENILSNYLKKSLLLQRVLLSLYDMISFSNINLIQDPEITNALSKYISKHKYYVLDFIPETYCGKRSEYYQNIANLEEDLEEYKLSSELKNFLKLFLADGVLINEMSFIRVNNKLSDIERYNLVFPISFLLNYKRGDLRRIKTLLDTSDSEKDFESNGIILFAKIKSLDSNDDITKDIFSNFNLIELSKELHTFLKKINHGTIHY